MRILLLVQHYFPNIQSCAKIMRDLAVALREEGHDVVLAAPDHRLRPRRTLTREDGITVLRARSGRFRDVPLPVRAFNEWSLPGTMWRGGKDFFLAHPCELIVCYSPPIFFGPLVRHLKRLWGSRVYLVLRDIFPQWSVDAGVIREGSLVHRVFRRYERLLYDTADVIGVQSRRNLDYFRDHDLGGDYRLEVLYNWASGDRAEKAETQVRRELGLEGKVVFLYGGNLGVAQDAGSVVRLADAMRSEPRAFFLVVGDGSEAGRLARDAEEKGLRNIRFLPGVELATYLGMVSECDVGLITLSRDLKTHNFPGKMLDYMCFAKPMLAAVNPGNDLRDILEEHATGLVCESGDDAEFYKSARRLTGDGELRRRCGLNGRALLEEVFSPRRAADRILAAV